MFCFAVFWLLLSLKSWSLKLNGMNENRHALCILCKAKSVVIHSCSVNNVRSTMFQVYIFLSYIDLC